MSGSRFSDMTATAGAGVGYALLLAAGCLASMLLAFMTVRFLTQERPEAATSKPSVTVESRGPGGKP
jgi:hypothetical protein